MDIATRGRSHLNELVSKLDSEKDLSKVFTYWPKKSFNNLENAKVYSFLPYFLPYFVYSKFIGYSKILHDFYDKNTRIDSLVRDSINEIILTDVNFSHHFVDSYHALLIDSPTSSFEFQIKQWERERVVTGVEIPRLNFTKNTYKKVSDAGVFAEAKQIIIPSSFSKSTYNLPSEKLTINPFWFSYDGQLIVDTRCKKDFNLVYIGIVCPSKGVHYLFEAVSMLKTSTITINIIGSISNKRYIKYLKNKYPNLNVIFHGYLSQNEINDLLIRMDLAVMPSVSEGLPLSYLNCIQHAVPIVSSYESGLSDILGSDFSYHSRDTEALAEKINYSLTHNLLIEQDIILKNTAHSYTLDRYIERWLNVIRNYK